MRARLIAMEKGGLTLDKNTIVVVDQAHQLDTRQMTALLERAEQARAKVILVGDPRQSPTGPGAPFRFLTERLGTAELSRNVRQREAWAREAVRATEAGKAEQALEAYRARGLLTIAPTRRKAMEAMAAAWRAGQSPDGRGPLLLAEQPQEVKALNRLVQKQRREAGELGSLRVTVGEETLYVGDRVRITRGSGVYGVRSNERGTVSLIEPLTRNVLLTMDDGRRVLLPLYRFHDLTLGYALTTRQAESLTRHETALALVGGGPQDRALSALQATRAVGETRLFVEETRVPHLAGEMNRERQNRWRGSWTSLRRSRSGATGRDAEESNDDERNSLRCSALRAGRTAL